MHAEKSFSYRAFASVIMLLSGLGLPVTGVANHMLQMEPLTTQRHAWMAAHNVLALIFSVSCVWHIVLNRTVLWRHVKGLAARFAAVSREAIYAAIVVCGLTSLIVSHAFHVH